MNRACSNFLRTSTKVLLTQYPCAVFAVAFSQKFAQVVQIQINSWDGPRAVQIKSTHVISYCRMVISSPEHQTENQSSKDA